MFADTPSSSNDSRSFSPRNIFSRLKNKHWLPKKMTFTGFVMAVGMFVAMTASVGAFVLIQQPGGFDLRQQAKIPDAPTPTCDPNAWTNYGSCRTDWPNRSGGCEERRVNNCGRFEYRGCTQPGGCTTQTPQDPTRPDPIVTCYDKNQECKTFALKESECRTEALPTNTKFRDLEGCLNAAGTLSIKEGEKCSGWQKCKCRDTGVVISPGQICKVANAPEKTSCYDLSNNCNLKNDVVGKVCNETQYFYTRVKCDEARNSGTGGRNETCSEAKRNECGRQGNICKVGYVDNKKTESCVAAGCGNTSCPANTACRVVASKPECLPICKDGINTQAGIANGHRCAQQGQTKAWAMCNEGYVRTITNISYVCLPKCSNRSGAWLSRPGKNTQSCGLDGSELYECKEGFIKPVGQEDGTDCVPATTETQVTPTLTMVESCKVKKGAIVLTLG
jgi:hypothetical protein